MKTLLDAVIDIANAEYDGHVSLLKFTTGWKVVFRTPGELFHPSAERAMLSKMPGFLNLDEALMYAIQKRPEFES